MELAYTAIREEGGPCEAIPQGENCFFFLKRIQLIVQQRDVMISFMQQLLMVFTLESLDGERSPLTPCEQNTILQDLVHNSRSFLNSAISNRDSIVVSSSVPINREWPRMPFKCKNRLTESPGGETNTLSLGHPRSEWHPIIFNRVPSSDIRGCNIKTQNKYGAYSFEGRLQRQIAYVFFCNQF
ncbi:hypothetical protein FGO68_gene17728 [Halteria grandinella]|uniref:Uncharacterized protein n=1 Tax=Halteria grandinella TaxID=5974 RepID=A0A8J8P2H3_HALGN|nr:hypothetical protein FGO68_gene17728 [Halteria grandinella]